MYRWTRSRTGATCCRTCADRSARTHAAANTDPHHRTHTHPQAYPVATCCRACADRSARTHADADADAHHLTHPQGYPVANRRPFTNASSESRQPCRINP